MKAQGRLGSLGAEGRLTLARLSASVEAALACLMEYEAQQRAAAEVAQAAREGAEQPMVTQK